MKHSRPDIANSVREASKVMDSATKSHWKYLLRIVKYVIDTKNYSLCHHIKSELFEYRKQSKNLGQVI